MLKLFLIYNLKKLIILLIGFIILLGMERLFIESSRNLIVLTWTQKRLKELYIIDAMWFNRAAYWSTIFLSYNPRPGQINMRITTVAFRTIRPFI